MLSEETTTRIAEARRDLLRAQEQIYGSRVKGREREAIEALVRAGYSYSEEIARGEAELGLRSRAGS